MTFQAIGPAAYALCTPSLVDQEEAVSVTALKGAGNVGEACLRCRQLTGRPTPVR